MDLRVKPEDDIVRGEALPAITDCHPGRSASGDPGSTRSQRLNKMHNFCGKRISE